ncbi:putative METHIONYL-TRNA SYNTHETASE, mitochondrial [Ophiocordyceps camponoti-floridani]|uniref:Putative METHIONYL-TRNA SYNTHETASE, mitochondrial n=1 Tax=Ophiocordyceps camponoti-floridani TaxID=2030778 RepID=A0A8H4VEI1_9HYPO|nr:putative METHIONYL-TRNA SYNTHETASE, mitochondrial [Ophiocordyceps camponoti-floridani]
MKLNENTSTSSPSTEMNRANSIAISTPNVLLIPYQAHHVPTYHTWMQDPRILAATASEPLTLQQEYENQISWRCASDKLTFIICEADGELRGDVNLFLQAESVDFFSGGEEDVITVEVDVMIAAEGHRRKGLGRAAVQTVLTYLLRHQDDLLNEYLHDDNGGNTRRIAGLKAKIGDDNVGSKALFYALGFRRAAGPDYFGEVTFVMGWAELREVVEGWLGEGGGYCEGKLS